MNTSVAIATKDRPGSFGVTPLGAPDAVPASPPHPPDCSVPQARAAELARCCITVDDLQADARTTRRCNEQLAYPPRMPAVREFQGSKKMLTTRLMWVLVSFAVVVPLAAQAAERTIEGVWRTAVTPLNCQTGEPVGVAPFPGLFTFHDDGTMSEFGIGPGSSPALRSPGHGVWQREHGWQDYSYTFMYYRYDSSGGFIGSQKVTSDLELAASGDAFVTKSVVEIIGVNNNVIATACASAAGTRFE